MFVLLDDVWHPVPRPGVQPDPVPHVHNSGWVQAPGAEILGDSARHGELEPYIKGVIGRFANDARVICWGPFIMSPITWPATPGRNTLEVKDKHIYSLALLKKSIYLGPGSQSITAPDLRNLEREKLKTGAIPKNYRPWTGT